MTLVRFASKCDTDGCGKRSEKYTEWPLCRCCGEHVCPAHARPSSLQEHDADRGGGEDGPAEAVYWEDVLCLNPACEDEDEDESLPINAS